jgi:hypothetical protein
VPIPRVAFSRRCLLPLPLFFRGVHEPRVFMLGFWRPDREPAERGAAREFVHVWHRVPIAASRKKPRVTQYDIRASLFFFGLRLNEFDNMIHLLY